MQYPIYEEYSATYRDAHSEEETTIRNDGQELHMTVRGVDFVGRTPAGFMIGASTIPEAVAAFTLNRDYNYAELCGCELVYEMPLPLSVSLSADGVNETKNALGVLRVSVVLGLPDTRRMLDVDTLRLELIYDGQTYRGTGWGECFETELLDIQKALPDNVFIHACINCAYSDYSPYGSDVYGSMMCFRNIKAIYLQVKNKMDFLRMEGTYTEQVQETYHCPQFARRIPGTGYRG